MIKPKACCIVDPFVSSDIICEALMARHILPIAILTDELELTEAEKNNRFQKEKFARVLSFTAEQDINQLAEELREFDLIAVIAGNERTCSIADRIAATLTPGRHNPIDTSAMRMDKFEMHEGIRRAGLAGIHQVKIISSDLTEKDKQSILQLQFPVIVKPTNQSGSMGVVYCESFVDVQAALERVMGKTSLYGSVVDACLAQECITGEEYFVDTVSYDGQHKIVGVYHYQKIIYNNNFLYRYVEPVELSAAQAILCSEYTRQVLSAVQLYNGMAHTEFFLTAAGPRLMEVNPRISGAHGMIAQLASLITGFNQAEILVNSLVDPVTFKSSLHDSESPRLQGRLIFLNTLVAKTFKKFHVEKVLGLSSYKSHKVTKKLGDQIHPPRDLLDTVVMVLLAHTDQEQVQKDYDVLIELEKNDLLFG